MVAEKVVEIVAGTVGLIGGIGIVLNRFNLLHFGKKNGKEKAPSGTNGLVLLTQCVSHKDLVEEVIRTKKDIADVKADTSYIRGRIDAMGK